MTKEECIKKIEHEIERKPRIGSTDDPFVKGWNTGAAYALSQIKEVKTASFQSVMVTTEQVIQALQKRIFPPKKLNHEQEKHWFKLGKYFAEKSMRDDLKAEYDRGWDDGHKSTYTGTQPHKCPVCEGRCRVKAEMYTIPTVNSPIFLQCNSCNGTGIVWG